MAEKAAKADASSAQEEAQAAASKDAETATAEKAAEAESGSNAETATAEKSDSGLPYTVKDGRATVVSKARAGKKIIAKTGEVIEFGSDGKASVRADDAAYLSAIAGFEFE